MELAWFFFHSYSVKHNVKLILKMMKVDNKVEPIDTESKQDIRPSTRKAFPQESQIPISRR